MRIGFCGTQSVGKSTLVKELAKLPEFEGYHISTERSKYLRDLGIPLNMDSTILGQQIFIAERASELFKDNLLTDRTCWDVAAFTKSAKSITKDEKEVLIKSSMLLGNFYDYVFYVSPEGVEIEQNGIREIDPTYRLDINNKILNLLSEYPPKNLNFISGSIKERVKFIKHVIGN